MRNVVILAMLVCLIATAAPGVAQTQPTMTDVIVAQAAQGEFTLLLGLLQSADPVFLELLSDPAAELTLFAPTDAAIEGWMEVTDDATLVGLFSDPTTLNDVIGYHLLLEEWEPQTGLVGPTIQGQYLDGIAEEDQRVDGAMIVDTIATPANGTIYVVDHLLLPETRTVWQILVDATDPIPAPPDIVSQPMNAELRATLPDFTALLSTVTSADMQAMLNDPEAEITLFAPHDAAFQVMDQSELSAIHADPARSTALILAQVVPGLLDYQTLRTGIDDETSFINAGGTPLDISATEDGFMVNGAPVVYYQIDAANGVIYVIPAVLTD